MNRSAVRFFATFALSALAALVIAGCGGVLDATIGGNVYGLSGGTSVVLLNNGADPVTVSANGSYTFDKTIEAGNDYDVTVETQPLGETCTVANATGSVTQNGGNISNVNVTCNATTTESNYVFGILSGLGSGQTLTLLNTSSTASETLSLTSNGAFSFKDALAAGNTYSVTVSTNPSGQTCTVANATGVIPTSGTNTVVTVTCQ